MEFICDNEKENWEPGDEATFLPCVRMCSRGRVFGLSVSLFVCLFVSLSTTFWPIHEQLHVQV